MLTKKISKLLSIPMSKSIIVNSVISDAAKSGFFETVDGISLYYEDTQAPGEVLFFIYGLGCSISHWKYQMSYFLDKSNKSKGVTQKYRIVWMDFRNHGRSGKCQSSQLSVVQLAEDVKQCCDVLGIHKAIFLGQSMGGSVLLQLAHSYPKLVKKMVLQGSPPIAPSRTICTSPLAPFAWKRMIQLNKLSPMSVRLIHKSLSGISRPLMEAARFSGFNPQLVNSDDVMEYVKLLLASDANVFWKLAESMENFDVADFGSEIIVPTLIIAGKQDRCVPLPNIEYLASKLKNAQVEVIPHGSHCPHLDDPPLVNELISRFIRKKRNAFSKKKNNL